MMSRGLLAALCLAMAEPSGAPALSEMRTTPAELQGDTRYVDPANDPAKR